MRPGNAVKGALCVLFSTFSFTTAAAIVKLLSPKYSTYEITFFRNIFGLIPAVWMSARIGGAGFRTTRIWSHFWRCFFGLGNMLLMFTAYRMISLPDATSISFAGPLFITALSFPLLGERVGRYRWGAVLAGFAGVLIVLRPGGGVFQQGGFLALSAAFSHALAMISLRKLRITENAEVTTFYFTLIATIITALLLPLGWRTPEPRDFLMLAAIGLISGAGQFALTKGYGLAEASVIAPFTYTSMIWASLFGALLWHETATGLTWLGTAIVICSGLYILHRERIRYRPSE